MFNEEIKNSELSMLKRKRTTLTTKVERLKEEIKTINKDIVALDQTIKLFSNDKEDKNKKVYSFAKGELANLILNESRIEVNSFTNKIVNLKNLQDKEYKKIKASVVATIHKLMNKGQLQKLSEGIYISKYNDHHCS